MKMFPVMAIATLVIGCDDDKAATVDATTETASEVSEVSETTPEIQAETEVEGEVVAPDPIELVGDWASEFGEETITTSNWDGYCIQTIVRVDNEANVAIIETLSGDGCALGFGRIVWTEIADDAFDYCTTTFAAASADEAASAEVSNFSTDLATGCGGFPWSHLTRK